MVSKDFLRKPGFAYAAMIPFCFQLSHDVWLCNWDAGSYSLVDDDEEEVDDPEEDAVCMEAYARGKTCLVEFTFYLLFCIQKKRYSVVVCCSCSCSGVEWNVV